METDVRTSPMNTAAPTPQDGVQPRSHTQLNPIAAPHTKADKSTIAAPEPYIRLFLLAWAVRYIPRGLLGEAFDPRTFKPIKKAVDWIIERGPLPRHIKRLEAVMAKHPELVGEARANAHVLSGKLPVQSKLYDEMSHVVHGWRGDASKQVRKLLQFAEPDANGVLKVGESSVKALHSTIRGRLDDMLYSIMLGLGSGALSIRYSRFVRMDIQNLFRESVAQEKGVPQEKVTFEDIAHSDNRIIRTTVANYRKKLWQRLGSDSLFLLAAPLKSMHITDLLLGGKGLQMLSETWRRNPTMFEDLVTFVNNKINPINGLGQPISMGEVFDLYQHYAQAYAPEQAFHGVIEHEKNEGARWVENQVIFQRMTELLNKTYAYKHASIVDQKTGLTVLQADFALPKFIYLLGHDFIDVKAPKQTLTAIEIANSYGIGAVQEMRQMLSAGKSLDEVVKRYPVTLPGVQVQNTPEVENGVLAKGASMQTDRVEGLGPIPGARIDATSILHRTALKAGEMPEHTV